MKQKIEKKPKTCFNPNPGTHSPLEEHLDVWNEKPLPVARLAVNLKTLWCGTLCAFAGHPSFTGSQDGLATLQPTARRAAEATVDSASIYRTLQIVRVWLLSILHLTADL